MHLPSQRSFGPGAPWPLPALLATMLLLPAALLPQAQVLGCEVTRAAPPRSANGDYQLILTNSYSEPANAYVIVATYSGPEGESAGMIHHSAVARDAIPPTGSDRPVPQRNSISITVFTNAASYYSCEIAATIYADGEVAGDTNVVSELVVRRQREESEYQMVIDQMTALGPSPSPQELARAAAILNRRARAWGNNRLGGELTAGDQPLAMLDRVDSPAAGFLNLLKARAPSQVGQELQKEIERLKVALLALQVSRPRPTE